MSRILYITFTGLLEPLGYSQVLRYIYGLSDLDWEFDIVSFEREVDLSDHLRVRNMEIALGRRGIRWRHLEYRSGALNIPVNMLRAASEASALVSPNALLHARSHLGATVAKMVSTTDGIPYLFDTRAYWIDERAEQGRWFTTPLKYRAAKRFERQLYRTAAGAITLTELAAADIENGEFGRWEGPLATVTTCADYREFRIGSRNSDIPESVANRLQGKLVFAFIGSINSWYRVDDSISLFAAVARKRPDAHLLGLSRQSAELTKRLIEAGVRPEQFTITSVRHDQMPAILTWCDWGFLLLNESYAKRNSMPTKLGEFFAAGVRPIASGCNREVLAWVDRARSGITLRELDEAAIERAATDIERRNLSMEELRRARTTTERHFSLRSGIESYDRIYQQLGGAR